MWTTVFFLPLLAAAAPLLETRVSDGSSWLGCQGSVNCEEYFNNGTGRMAIRFKSGMGPESDWFKENVPEVEWNYVKERDLNALSPRSSDYKTSLAHSAERLQWGTDGAAGTLVTVLAHHCSGGGCSAGPFVVTTKYTTSDKSFAEDYDLNFQIDDAQWPISESGAQGYFQDAVGDMAAKLVQTRSFQATECFPDGKGTGGCNTEKYTFHTSGKYFEVQRRYTPTQALIGFVRISVTMTEAANSDSCSEVLGALAAIFGAAGGIGAIGGGFFGLLGATACTN